MIIGLDRIGLVLFLNLYLQTDFDIYTFLDAEKHWEPMKYFGGEPSMEALARAIRSCTCVKTE